MGHNVCSVAPGFREGSEFRYRIYRVWALVAICTRFALLSRSLPARRQAGKQWQHLYPKAQNFPKREDTKPYLRAMPKDLDYTLTSSPHYFLDPETSTHNNKMLRVEGLAKPSSRCSSETDKNHGQCLGQASSCTGQVPPAAGLCPKRGE